MLNLFNTNMNIELKPNLLISAEIYIQKTGMLTSSNKVYGPFWKVAKNYY